ncbi:MAG: hypothetical protein KDK36_02165, partial [Leptospiraceae bacterium]|nr:hypothetical protein [Leptospiraceae bacterium]
PKVLSALLYILEIDRVLLSLVIVYFMIKAIKDKKEGSILFLTGFLVIFLFSMLDVLTARSVINAPRITKFGLSLMVLLQAIILAKAFTRDFKTTEKLTKSLSGINQSLSKFVPTEFFKLLGKESFADIKLGDHVQKEMTILFSDIRAFTTLSEQMTPEENFKFINSYLNEITPIIKKNNGFIDKFIGDAIMGLFPGTADDAVRASIEIQKTITEFNNSRKSSGLPELKVGIGLHTGDLILGTIGHDERMESTVISDSVNLASRIEGLTKFYGSEILISEDTFNELEDPYVYKVRLLDNVIVKGKKDSIFVVEVLDGFSEDLLEKFSKTRELFETGSLMYKQAAFEAAIDYFKKVLDINPQDTASAFYLKRAEYYNVHGAPPEWEGIEEFLDK